MVRKTCRLEPATLYLKRQVLRGTSRIIDLKYSLVIEATEDPTFFGFYSPDLEGFTGVGHSIEDCLYQARWGMQEHVEMLRQQGVPIPLVTSARPLRAGRGPAQRRRTAPRGRSRDPPTSRRWSSGRFPDAAVR